MIPVRLAENTLQQLSDSFRRWFLPQDQLWVFGSRADPASKGGDLDLYIETALDVSEVVLRKLHFLKDLFFILEGQKVDVVIHYQNAPPLLIYQQAKETGIQIL